MTYIINPPGLSSTNILKIDSLSGHYTYLPYIAKKHGGEIVQQTFAEQVYVTVRLLFVRDYAL